MIILIIEGSKEKTKMKETFENIYKDLILAFVENYGREPSKGEKSALRNMAQVGTALIVGATDTKIREEIL